MSDVVHSKPLSTYFVPKYVDYIEYIADKLFVSSFLLNKIKDLPIPCFSPICSYLAIILLALAFSLQLFSSPYYQTQASHTWNYRQRAFMFNLIGSLTAWTCILFPEIWLICTWLFCLNNLIWIYNEQNKKDSPSIYPKTAKNQTAYCHYVMSMCFATLVSALSHSFDFILIGRILNWFTTGLGLYFLWQSGQDKQEESRAPIGLELQKI